MCSTVAAHVEYALSQAGAQLLLASVQHRLTRNVQQVASMENEVERVFWP